MVRLQAASEGYRRRPPAGPRGCAAHTGERSPQARHSRAVLWGRLSDRVGPRASLRPMVELPPSFQFLMRGAVLIWGTLTGRDRMYERPAKATKAVAKRLRQGLAVLEAYLHRLVMLLALTIEPSLVHVEHELKRPREKDRLANRLRPRSVRLFAPQADWPEDGVERSVRRRVIVRGDVPLAPLHARLQALEKVMANPMARARRMAWQLARTRPGILLAPTSRTGVPNRWGTEPSALYDAMAADIPRLSRDRPPPLPPRRSKRWPSITLL